MKNKRLTHYKKHFKGFQTFPAPDRFGLQVTVKQKQRPIYTAFNASPDVTVIHLIII